MALVHLIDSARMRAMRDEHGELLGRLIDIFAETTPDALNDLQAARERDDPETVRRVAHSLKGACMNVGATVMAEHCRALESDPASAVIEIDRLTAAYAPTLAALRGAATRA